MPRVRPVSHTGCTWTGLAPEQLPSETIRGSEKMGPVAYFSLCLLGCLTYNPSLAGWFSFHDSCYRFFPKEKNWMDAEAHCQHHCHGAHLASIHSAGENKMLAHYIKKYNRKKHSVWIGLSDPEQDQDWRWSDNSLLSFTAWNKGQPDSPSKNEHCVVLERPGFQIWDDYPCEDRFPFICKHKP